MTGKFRGVGRWLWLSLVILCGTGLSLRAQLQPTFGNFSVGRGEVLKHSDNQNNYTDLGTISYQSFTLDAGLEASSVFTWADAFDNPKTGLTFLGSRFSDPSIDYVLGLLVFISKEYALFNSPVFWYYHVGYGLTYTGNTFNQETNYSNETVSTRVNASTNLRTGLGIRFAENWRLRLGGSLLHSSNVGVRKPNFGINQYELMLGLGYQFRADKPPLEPKESTLPEQEFLLMGHIGPRQVAYEDPYLAVYDIDVEYNRMINRVIRLGLGMTLMEDGIAYEHKKYLEPVEGEVYESLGFFEALTFGTHLNLELAFNRLSLVGQVGYYWKHPHRDIRQEPNLPVDYSEYMDYHNEHYIYNRIGYRYRHKSGLVISLIGKTQLFKIQYTSLGLGYSF